MYIMSLFLLIVVLYLKVCKAQYWSQVGGTIVGEYIFCLAIYDRTYSVSLSSSGTRVAIGAPQNSNGDDTYGADGHVRVYEYDSSTWVQLGSDIDGESGADLSGYSVALSTDGTRVAIGAPENDGGGAASGHVRVYDYDSSDWVQIGSDIDGPVAQDKSGHSVSLSSSGSRLAVGMIGCDNTASQSGCVRVYDYVTSSWTQVGSDIDGEAHGDQSGFSVSLSADGSRIAIGARYNDDGGTWAGQARVYQFDSSTWVQLGGDMDGDSDYNAFGYSVSLSANGDYVAVGAPTGFQGTVRTGFVRVFGYDSSTWIQRGSDLYGEAQNDESGNSVSLSADGGRVAIGAPENDDGGTNAGHVRVYDYDSATSSWIQGRRNHCWRSWDPTLTAARRITKVLRCHSVLMAIFWLQEHSKVQVATARLEFGNFQGNRVHHRPPHHHPHLRVNQRSA